MRISLNILLLLLFSAIMLSKSAVYDSIKTVKIELQDSTAIIPDETMVILFENESYLIFARNIIFINELKDLAEKFNPAKKLYSIFKDKQFTGTYCSDSVLNESYHREMLKFITAYLLGSGKCFLLNKNSNTLIKSITIEYFNSLYSFGRRFKDTGKVILEVFDGDQ